MSCAVLEANAAGERRAEETGIGGLFGGASESSPRYASLQRRYGRADAALVTVPSDPKISTGLQRLCVIPDQPALHLSASDGSGFYGSFRSGSSQWGVDQDGTNPDHSPPQSGSR
ncbi:hypothetical protein SKAU_G00164020 [Synaphobranchus kaupii]|uniref:Uncharacterized protein n=1 Tax=Synaphobranchus kaupii TaxID=118154 RepID=A0A9Q1FJK8_SYNKA|nr:hypothetical protein SKAU_G00164020 [Synaphobranchus kaupii]